MPTMNLKFRVYHLIFIIYLLVGCDSYKESEELRMEAYSYFEKEEYQKSLELLDKSIELNSRNSKSYIDRAIVYSTLTHFDKAIEDYSRILKYDNDNQLAYLNRGTNYQRSGDFKSAINDYNEAILLASNDQTIREDNIVGMLDETIEGHIPDEEIIYDVEVLNIKYWRGQAYYLNKSYERSLVDLTELIENGYSDSTVYYYRGLSYLNIDSVELGCNDLFTAHMRGSKLAIEIILEKCDLRISKTIN